MGVIYRLPVSVDDLDAAVYRSIPDYSPGVVEFRREERPPALVVYKLWQGELDDLGEIKLDRVDAKRSTLEIEPPPLPPTPAPTSEELDALKAISDPNKRLYLAAMQSKRRVESDDLYRRRKEHHKVVIEAFFARLERDPVWGDEGMWAAIQKRVPIAVAEPPQATPAPEPPLGAPSPEPPQVGQAEAQAFREGEVRGEQAGQERIVLQRGKPGQKPDPLYDEAFQKIEEGLSALEAYDWYCQEVPIKVPDKGTRDSFKAAMRRRQNRRQDAAK